MKKLTLIFVFLLASSSFAQTFRPDMLVAPTRLRLDGEASVLKTPLILGVVTDFTLGVIPFAPGLYLSIGIDTQDNKDLDLGLVFNIKIFRGFGLGLDSTFYTSKNGGLTKLLKENSTSILISYDLSIFN